MALRVGGRIAPVSAWLWVCQAAQVTHYPDGDHAFVLADNAFIEAVLPGAIQRPLDDEEMAATERSGWLPPSREGHPGAGHYQTPSPNASQMPTGALVDLPGTMSARGQDSNLEHTAPKAWLHDPLRTKGLPDARPDSLS